MHPRLTALLLAVAVQPIVAQQIATASPTVTAATSVAAPPAPNTLLDGTAIKLRLNETVSSADAKKGQQVSLRVVEDVVVDGVVVLPRGAQALATIMDAAPKRGLGRGGKLDINVDSARLADGELVPLRAIKDVHGGGHVAVMTTGIVATTILFFPAAPLFLFIHGKDITIPAGSAVTAFVQGDKTLDMAKFSGLAAMPVANVSVLVEANTPSAEINVDGMLMGSTPSTISLDPGTHTVILKKEGFNDWSRTITVQGASAHISAEMKLK